MARARAETDIGNRIALGRELRTAQITSYEDLQRARKDVDRWDKYNDELLTRYFSDRSKADEYGLFYGSSQRIVTPGNPITTQEELARLHTVLDTKLQRLEVLLEQLPLIPECAHARTGSASSVDLSSAAREQERVANPRKVMVVFGRNHSARAAMFSFLRSIKLDPIEWAEAVKETRKASPYIGEVLDAAFSMAQAVVVLLTPDDEAWLRPEFRSAHDPPHEVNPTPQARPNVIFEAGMAIGRDDSRTVLVELGRLRPFSDVAGRHTVRIDNSTQRRQELADRLRTAGCAVDLSGTDWHTEGDFTLKETEPTPIVPVPETSQTLLGAFVATNQRLHDAPTHGITLEISQPVYARWTSPERIDGEIFVTVRNPWIHPLNCKKVTLRVEIPSWDSHIQAQTDDEERIVGVMSGDSRRLKWVWFTTESERSHLRIAEDRQSMVTVSMAPTAYMESEGQTFQVTQPTSCVAVLSARREPVVSPLEFLFDASREPYVQTDNMYVASPTGGPAVPTAGVTYRVGLRNNGTQTLREVQVILVSVDPAPTNKVLPLVLRRKDDNEPPFTQSRGFVIHPGQVEYVDVLMQAQDHDLEVQHIVEVPRNLLPTECSVTLAAFARDLASPPTARFAVRVNASGELEFWRSTETPMG